MSHRDDISLDGPLEFLNSIVEKYTRNYRRLIKCWLCEQWCYTDIFVYNDKYSNFSFCVPCSKNPPMDKLENIFNDFLIGTIRELVK